jgi:hypothetical protein
MTGWDGTNQATRVRAILIRRACNFQDARQLVSERDKWRSTGEQDQGDGKLASVK